MGECRSDRPVGIGKPHCFHELHAAGRALQLSRQLWLCHVAIECSDFIRHGIERGVPYGKRIDARRAGDFRPAVVEPNNLAPRPIILRTFFDTDAVRTRRRIIFAPYHCIRATGWTRTGVNRFYRKKTHTTENRQNAQRYFIATASTTSPQ